MLRNLPTPLARLLAPLMALLALGLPSAARASEVDLVLPDFRSVTFFGGLTGWTLLFAGIFVCAAGMGFGLWIFRQLKNMPVHESMREISELIYETCKTYLLTQGKFILVLWAFITA